MDYKNNRNKHRQNKLTDKDYEGVIYEPSSAAKGENRSRREPGRSNSTPTRRKLPVKQQKSQFALFYIITLFVGVVICIVIFAIVFSNITKNNGDSNVKTPVATASPEPSAGPIKETQETVAVIESIDTGKNTLRLLDVNSDKRYSLEADSSTTMQNKHGQTLVFAEFKIGDIVTAEFDTKNNKLNSLIIDPLAWEYKLTKEATIANDIQTITLGNEIYTYDSTLIVQRNSQPYDIAGLASIDILTIRGYNKKALYLEVNKSHGYIEVLNKDKIKDGTLEIDTSVFMPLDESEKMEVLEGPHKIVVKGSNIEPYSKDVTIGQGETILLDLADVQYKSCILNITVNTTDYTTFVDSKEVSKDLPIVLNFGEHTIKVEREGFITYEETIQVTDPTQDLAVELKEEIKMSKLVITSDPEGTEVYIDSGFIGTTPAEASITYGNHTITAKMEGYQTIDIPFSAEKKEEKYHIIMRLLPPVYPTAGDVLPSTNPPAEEFPASGD